MAKTTTPRLVVPMGDTPTAPEILEKHIIEISESMQKLLAGPIKRETIILLIQETCLIKISRRDIGYVLDGIENLRVQHCKR